ncbi:hypothetical protein VZ95_08505 [Elstera litoralis]|uniref:Prolyl 4-hydroxylase alpha subunit Fe(2+) 2OG dioxygenase domain-containing protein n=1 Tax=Elstera litoralis TaxID=552518 RepID=A0A0F3IT63_9PROT|nr:2OG-Fe(II) oxygenase [Elstera litoralis]KJV09901.1 hypothetical protein VZ95_08505 [Elstera litoralis]
MRSLLAGLGRADIRTAPFPHVVVSDALDPAVYRDLAAGFPSLERMTWQMPPEKVPNNRRYVMPASSVIDAPDLPVGWQDFARLHSSPEFLTGVAALFQDYWPPALMAALGGQFEGHPISRLRMLGLPAEAGLLIGQDARLEVNTPVRDQPSSVRGPHLDTLNRLYSGLFYLRAPEDDSVGGELILYRWRHGPSADLGAFTQPADAVEEVVRIPYRANQFVLFPQNIHALHGVGVRHPTPHLRRYVFITAELNRDWLAPLEGDA